jgi:hypothetical protein
MSRGNQACKHVREILKFFDNTHNTYYLYMDNQAAEHLATQPNMSDNSRSIDIRHHEIKQDYVEGGMRIGGVSSKDNTADILTKTLQPPQHAKHCKPLHILQPTMTSSHVITVHNHSNFHRNLQGKEYNDPIPPIRPKTTRTILTFLIFQFITISTRLPSLFSPILRSSRRSQLHNHIQRRMEQQNKRQNTNAENETAHQYTKTNDATKTASQQNPLHKLQGEHQNTEPIQRKLHANPRAHPSSDTTIQNPRQVTYITTA